MSSFEEMFSRYFSRVYKFALKLTRSTEQAEDITQQTFYRALEKINSFEGRSDVGTWLCSIAKNEYFDRCRRKKETAAMRNALAVGDEIVTIGGVTGTVCAVKDETIVIETGADRVRIEFHKWAISSRNAEKK